MAAVTRLGLHGGPRGLYGDFSGRTENIVVEDTEKFGGSSKSKRGRKYPRWVVIDGQRFRVNSPEEERQLLLAMLDRAKEVEATAAPAEAKQARKRIIRIEKRVKAVDDSEAQWMQRLREMDEELLLLI